MPTYQPYAPTPYLTPPLTAPTLNLDLEQKLFSTSSQRELLESLAELHAILVTLDFVEKASIKDTLPAASYTPVCRRLVGQYNALLANDTVAAEFVSLGAFKARYGIDCPAATRRIEMGLPQEEEAAGRREAAAAAAATGVSPKAAAEATQNLITFMDALRLGYRAKDELHPLLAQVVTSVDRVREGFEGREGIVRWLIVLNRMRPGDEVDEKQGREMLWDLERAYNSFLEGLG